MNTKNIKFLKKHLNENNNKKKNENEFKHNKLLQTQTTKKKK
jgi:hypothetical protein